MSDVRVGQLATLTCLLLAISTAINTWLICRLINDFRNLNDRLEQLEYRVPAGYDDAAPH